MINKFAHLVESLDKEIPGGGEVHPHLFNFFAGLHEDSDRLWAVYLLQKGIHNRVGSYPVLKVFVAGITGIPDWIIDHSANVTGDKAEALALMFQNAGSGEISLTRVMNFVTGFKSLSEESKKNGLNEIWTSCDVPGRRLVNKMIMTGFSANVRSQDLAECLAKLTGCLKHTLATRLDTPWQPHLTTWSALTRNEDQTQENNHPYAFCPVQTTDENQVSHLPIQNYLAEYRWKGIRFQCVWRNGTVSVWAKDGKLISREVPELNPQVLSPFTSLVFEGCIVNPTGDHEKKKSSASPNNLVIFHDLLEFNQNDITNLPLDQRKEILTTVLADLGDNPNLRLSPCLDFSALTHLQSLRAKAGTRYATGIILKDKKADAFQTPWLEWQADPHKLLAVIMYVKTDPSAAREPVEYTLGVWKRENGIPMLISIAKCPPPEFGQQLESFLEVLYAQVDGKFGPVLNLRHHMVVRLKFDHALPSSRHKSGYILVRPTMEAWLPGQAADQADDLAGLEQTVLTNRAL